MSNDELERVTDTVNKALSADPGNELLLTFSRVLIMLHFEKMRHHLLRRRIEGAAGLGLSLKGATP